VRVHNWDVASCSGSRSVDTRDAALILGAPKMAQTQSGWRGKFGFEKIEHRPDPSAVFVSSPSKAGRLWTLRSGERVLLAAPIAAPGDEPPPDRLIGLSLNFR